MISVEEALGKVHLCNVEREIISVPLDKSLNQVLVKDFYSFVDLPNFRQSAMDGYALCGKHSTYHIVDEVPAGDTRKITLNDGECCRIFTGAMVPDNATMVIMQEKVEVLGDEIMVKDDFVEGRNIRPVGEQIKANTKVFEAGMDINPATIGLLRSLGTEFIKVYKQPAISLIVTGDELKFPGVPLMPGEIYESNSSTLISAAKDKGYKIGYLCKVNDNLKNTIDVIRNSLAKSDVVLISGGISVGDYDLVESSLKENGVEEIFYKVNQKPGKPIYFGRKGNKFVFALPGNPAAALTCFYIYVLPLLDKIRGSRSIGADRVELPIAHDYQTKGNRTSLLKSKIENNKVVVVERQSSSVLYAFAKANSIAMIDENISQVKKGDLITVFKI